MAISSVPIKRKQNYDIGSLLARGDATFENTVTLGMDPVEAMHAATKQYVDAVQQGLDVKKSVRVATTAEEAGLDLDNAPITIDGVTLKLGDRVLVKNGAFSSVAEETIEDATNARNGIYVVAELLDADEDEVEDTVVLVRAKDANDDEDKVSPGMFMFVEEGAKNQDTGFVLVTDEPVELGVTELEFTPFSKAAELLAGLGLIKEGNVIKIKEGGVTDGMLGERTIDDTILPTDTGALTELLGGLAHEIKMIKGTEDWKDPANPASNLATPEPVANVVPIEVGANVDVSFDLPSEREGINKYEIWRAYGEEGIYKLVGVMEDESIDADAATATFTDEELDRIGLIKYKVYAVKNGIRSEAVSGEVTTVNKVGEPANLQVVATSDYYDIRFDLPRDKRLKEIVVKVDKSHEEDILSEENAIEIYRGLSDNLTYVIPEADMDKFHQFYVYAITKTV